MAAGAVKIIGLDPGLQISGWGVIEAEGHQIRHVAHGTVTSTKTLTLPERLKEIYEGLAKVIETYMPEEAGVEETFVNTNAASTLKLGQARGVVMLAPALMGLPVAEYSANRVKKAVVGAGHASKDQISLMVQMLLPKAGKVTKDAADALAVAICHAHYRTTHHLLDAQKLKAS